MCPAKDCHNFFFESMFFFQWRIQIPPGKLNFKFHILEIYRVLCDVFGKIHKITLERL